MYVLKNSPLLVELRCFIHLVDWCLFFPSSTCDTCLCGGTSAKAVLVLMSLFCYWCHLDGTYESESRLRSCICCSLGGEAVYNFCQKAPSSSCWLLLWQYPFRTVNATAKAVKAFLVINVHNIKYHQMHVWHTAVFQYMDVLCVCLCWFPLSVCHVSMSNCSEEPAATVHHKKEGKKEKEKQSVALKRLLSVFWVEKV